MMCISGYLSAVRAHSQCDQMLSADHKRQLPVVQDIIRTFPDLLQYFLRASDRQFQITAVVYDIFSSSLSWYGL